MDELIFFAVIIFFSIVESIARSRKKKKAGAEAPGEGFPGLPDPSDWESERAEHEAELPTYDADPSYDDRYQPRSREGRSREGHGSATRPARQDGGASRPSSEEMLPGDLLEELSRMAGRLQERQARPIKIPKESPPLPQPVDRPPTRERTPSRPISVSRGRLPVRAPRSVPDRPQHHVHEAHAGYGTDPSSRPPSFHDTLDPLAEQLSEDAKAVRNQLRSRDTGALRQAFLLREVLGEPLGMRE